MRELRSGTGRLFLEYLAYVRKSRAESRYPDLLECLSPTPRTCRTHIDRVPLDRAPAVPQTCRQP